MKRNLGARNTEAAISAFLEAEFLDPPRYKSTCNRSHSALQLRACSLVPLGRLVAWLLLRLMHSVHASYSGWHSPSCSWPVPFEERASALRFASSQSTQTGSSAIGQLPRRSSHEPSERRE